MLKGHAYLIWQTLPYLAMKDSRKSPSPMLCQWGYRDIVQVLAISSAQVPAGRRINFGGLAFASKAILRQNTSDPAICRLCLSFPLNNSNILEKGLIIPLRRNAKTDKKHAIYLIIITQPHTRFFLMKPGVSGQMSPFVCTIHFNSTSLNRRNQRQRKNI